MIPIRTRFLIVAISRRRAGTRRRRAGRRRKTSGRHCATGEPTDRRPARLERRHRDVYSGDSGDRQDRRIHGARSLFPGPARFHRRAELYPDRRPRRAARRMEAAPAQEPADGVSSPAASPRWCFPMPTRSTARPTSFDYVRREFLGEVRCLVFDVSPLDNKARGKFIGRIWVEDRGLQIVRFNGTYTRGSASHLYFHFDSWRVNVEPGRWVPAFIYVEEAQPTGKTSAVPRFKAQTRLWAFHTAKGGRLEELASIAIEAEKPIKDESKASENSPLESQRSWERQAETNILERLEKAGLLAPVGPVDEVLNTVINNLIVSNHLNIEANGRVLLTTPLETFSIGQTIVISRGLLDVLPDEASLAMVLSDELAHIALGHRTDTHFAFSDQVMLGDADLLRRSATRASGRPDRERGRQSGRDARRIALQREADERGAIPESAGQPVVAVAEPDSCQPGRSVRRRRRAWRGWNRWRRRRRPWSRTSWNRSQRSRWARASNSTPGITRSRLVKDASGLAALGARQTPVRNHAVHDLAVARESSRRSQGGCA